MIPVVLCNVIFMYYIISFVTFDFLFITVISVSFRFLYYCIICCFVPFSLFVTEFNYVCFIYYIFSYFTSSLTFYPVFYFISYPVLLNYFVFHLLDWKESPVAFEVGKHTNDCFVLMDTCIQR